METLQTQKRYLHVLLIINVNFLLATSGWAADIELLVEKRQVSALIQAGFQLVLTLISE